VPSFHYNGDYIPWAIKHVDERDIPEIPANHHDITQAIKISQFNSVLP
jgi:hypothetical protein